jgi:hypothetical protein
MSNIEWLDQPDEDDGTYDFCGMLDDKYVDVIGNLDQTLWSVSFNGKRLKDGFTTREEARSWAENTDLVDYLCGK